jgi:hypothetical protein
MDHGVDPEEFFERERPHGQASGKAHRGHEELPIPYPSPVPVTIVPQHAGTHPLKYAVLRQVTVQAIGAGDPTQICGADEYRTLVRVLNPDAAVDIVIGLKLTDLISDPGAAANSKTIGGALLKHGMTQYQDITTSDSMYAVTLHASTTVRLSMILETQEPGAAP